jgi:hypothetical protein
MEIKQDNPIDKIPLIIILMITPNQDMGIEMVVKRMEIHLRIRKVLLLSWLGEEASNNKIKVLPMNLVDLTKVVNHQVVCSFQVNRARKTQRKKLRMKKRR